jgi:hypothetical protein
MLTNADRITAAVLVAVLAAAYVVLVTTGHDPTVIGALLTGPAVSAALGLLLMKRTNDLQQLTDSREELASLDRHARSISVGHAINDLAKKVDNATAAGAIVPAVLVPASQVPGVVVPGVTA